MAAQLATYLGPRMARDELGNACEKLGIANDDDTAISGDEAIKLRHLLERNLVGLLGPGIARLIVDNRLILSETEASAFSSSILTIRERLRLGSEQMRELSDELVMLKEYSEAVIRSLPVGVVALDDDFRVVSLNPAAEVILDLNGDDAEGRELSVIAPEFTMDSMTQGQKQVQVGEIHRRLDFAVTVAGSIRHLNIACTRFSMGAMGSAGRVILIEDVTKTRELQRHLAHSDRLASIGGLAAGVAHEIGNPLTGISSLTQMMREELDDREFLDQSLDKVHKETIRIQKIVRNLLDFSRAQDSIDELVDMGNVINKALDLAGYDMRFKKIDIQYSPPTDRVNVKGGEHQLQQVILNLLINAADAIGDKGGKIKITMQSYPRLVRLTVTDSGPGIPKAIHNKLFDPFFTTKNDGKGVGLGLSICFGIIRGHGGTIHAGSSDDGGGKFTINLPNPNVA